MKVIINKENRNSIRLRVTGECQIEVTAPVHCRNSEIDALLIRKRRWIEKRVALLQTEQSRLNQFRLQLPSLGYAADPTKSIPPIQQRKLRNAARLQFTAIVNRLVELHGLPSPNAIRIKKMKSRWGSCSGAGNINLNYYLYFTPPSCIEYVILHELVHLVHLHHGAAFHHLLEGCMPDAPKRKKVLREWEFLLRMEE